MPTVFHLSGPLDVAAMEKALAAVAERHDSLRTVFAQPEGGQAVQKVLPVQPFALPVVPAGRDLAKLPVQQQRRALNQLLQGEVRKPFDLATGPLWRARLFQLAPKP